MDITYGNAIEDGKRFRFWFVGEIEKWCSEKGIVFAREEYGLRNTSNIEVKWGIYRKGEERDTWAGSSERIGMSILLRGDCIFKFRDPQRGSMKEVRLSEEGDYVIWRENIEHTWIMLDDSVFITIRWRGEE